MLTGGSVTASGVGGTGISAQGNGDPIITLAPGTRVTGGPSGTAISSDGTETYITSYGTPPPWTGPTGSLSAPARASRRSSMAAA